MSRRSLLAILGSLAILIAAGGGLFFAFRHTPSFYEQELAAPRSEEWRHEQATAFLRSASQLEGAMRLDETWGASFTQDEVNAFLAEELTDHYAGWVPESVSNPRVRLNDRQVDLVFQYRRDWWQGTVHVQIAPQLLATGQLALHVRTIRAGAVPIPPAEPLTKIVESLRKRGWEIQWRPTRDGEMLVLDLAPLLSSKIALDELRLTPGNLRIIGHRTTPPDRVSPPPAPQFPRTARESDTDRHRQSAAVVEPIAAPRTTVQINSTAAPRRK